MSHTYIRGIEDKFWDHESLLIYCQVLNEFILKVSKFWKGTFFGSAGLWCIPSFAVHSLVGRSV